MSDRSLDRNTKFHYKRSNIDFNYIGKWKQQNMYVVYFLFTMFSIYGKKIVQIIYWYLKLATVRLYRENLGQLRY